MSQHTSRSIENLLIHPLNRGFDFFVKKKTTAIWSRCAPIEKVEKDVVKSFKHNYPALPEPGTRNYAKFSNS